MIIAVSFASSAILPAVVLKLLCTIFNFLSGSFGSRQEEAQRLGRILRPKDRNSWFYSLVSRGTVEEDFAVNRQRFLTEQGYRYTIDIWEDL